MPTLSQNDPEPTERGGPSPWLVIAIGVVVAIVVGLHLTGVIGGG